MDRQGPPEVDGRIKNSDDADDVRDVCPSDTDLVTRDLGRQASTTGEPCTPFC